MGDKYNVDSAGTAAYHVGESPDVRMRQVAASHGLSYNGRGRQLDFEDFYRFDYIIPMDKSNRDNILSMAKDEIQRAKVHMMREFDPQASPGDAVPDPYYGGIDGFEHVYRIVSRACQGLLEALEAGEIEV